MWILPLPDKIICDFKRRHMCCSWYIRLSLLVNSMYTVRQRFAYFPLFSYSVNFHPPRQHLSFPLSFPSLTLTRCLTCLLFPLSFASSSISSFCLKWRDPMTDSDWFSQDCVDCKAAIGAFQSCCALWRAIAHPNGPVLSASAWSFLWKETRVERVCVCKTDHCDASIW